MSDSKRRRDSYEGPLFYGLGWAALFGFWSGTILDMGALSTICEGTLITYGALFLLIAVRRPKQPTRGDLLMLKWGFPILYFVGVLVYPYMWYLRGAR